MLDGLLYLPHTQRQETLTPTFRSPACNPLTREVTEVKHEKDTGVPKPRHRYRRWRQAVCLLRSFGSASCVEGEVYCMATASTMHCPGSVAPPELHRCLSFIERCLCIPLCYPSLYVFITLFCISSWTCFVCVHNLILYVFMTILCMCLWPYFVCVYNIICICLWPYFVCVYDLTLYA